MLPARTCLGALTCARYERANNDCSKYGAVEDLKAEVEAMLQRKKQAQKQKEPEVAAAKKDEL